MKSVLVVCIGNICRSPMAEGLLKFELPKVRVESAGIGALLGRRADPLAVRLMESQGIDISAHTARQINASLMQSELILVMDTEQKVHLEAAYPAAKGRIFRIAEDQKMDVPDPYRKNESAFNYSFQIIEKGLEAWINRIKKLNEKFDV